MITEFAGGRVFEVNDNGEVVWEYLSRFDDEEVIEIADSIRYPENYFTVKDWTCN